MIPRPSLLLMTAAVSGMAVVANGVTAATPQTAQQDAPAPKSRLGTAIQQDLDARAAETARQRRALNLREQAARAAEARLAAQLEERRQGAADGATAAAEAQAAGQQFDDLARIYQAMKPAKAAIVFEQLEMDVQLRVAQRMRERSTAQILANMTPGGAAALSMALARGHVSTEPRAQRPPVTRRPPAPAPANR